MELPIATSGPPRPRGGTHWDCGSNIPTPRYHRCCIPLAGSYLRTCVRFLSQLYSRRAKGVLYPHVGGTMTHRARIVRPWLDKREAYRFA